MSQLVRTTDAEMTLGLDIPQRFTVVGCTLAEGMSQLTHARVEIAATDYLDLHEVLEKDAVLDMAPEGFPDRRWTLRVGHLEFSRIVDGSLRYLVHLYPALWLLRLTRNIRKFRDEAAEAIVGKVLAERKIAHRFALTRPTEVRKYCVQYRETNLDFVLRLLEFEGIYYWFEPDGTLVMADASGSSPRVAGPPAYELCDAAGSLQWNAPGVYAFSHGRRVASGTATVNDHNWKKPQTSLRKSRSAAEDADLEIYDYPVGYRRLDQGELLARLRLEAERVPAKYAAGSGNVPSFAPARLFRFDGDPRFSGEYLLTKVEHCYHNRKFRTGAVAADSAVETSLDGAQEGVNYRNHFEAIPKDVPFRPALVTPHPHLGGCHTAMVRGPEGEEIHTDRYGRFKAQFHWDREATGSDDDSRWLRALQETQTGTVLARVGWEMSVSYIHGDPDRPIGIARKINGIMQAEYGQPDNKTRMTVKTPTYPDNGGFNEMRLEDLAGAMHFFWHAEKNFIGAVVRDKTETVGGNETVNVAENYSHTVEHDQTTSIGGDYKVHVDKTYRSHVGNDRQDKVGGDEKLQVEDVVAVQVSGNDVEKVGGDRKTETKDNGAIERTMTEDFTRKIGGTWTAKGDGNFTGAVQDKLAEKVGGAKETTADKGNIGINVTGKFDQKVGGSATRQSDKDQGYSANKTQIAIHGNAAFQAGERIEISGDKIVLQAQSSLSFKQGGLEITLTPGSVAIKGKMKLDAKDSVTVQSPANNITK